MNVKPLTKVDPAVYELHLDKLAQVRTAEKNPEQIDKLKPVTRKEHTDKLTKRARAKYLSYNVARKLSMVEGSPLNKSYINTLFCCREIIETDTGEMVAKYCKNRWCLVCNRIRTAQLINQYLPTLEQWKDKYFVTLTVPNVSGDQLTPTLERMQTEFRKTVDLYRQRSKRAATIDPHGSGELIYDKLAGIRKLEITYNKSRNDFHPHYHLIVKSKDQAQFIVLNWLDRFPTADEKAQDLKPADDNSTKELFKYFTKVVHRPKYHQQGGQSWELYPAAKLDTIFQAMHGKRVFQTFGFTLPKDPEIIEEKNTDDLKPVTVWRYVATVTDWIDHDTGEFLTDYKPPDKLRELFKPHPRPPDPG